MIQVYKDVIFYRVFQNGTIKKIQPLKAQYGQKFQQTSKHQYDESNTRLNFSAILP